MAETRRDYNIAYILLSEIDQYRLTVQCRLAIQMLDQAIKRVPTFIDAYYLREEAWHRYLKGTKGTQQQAEAYRSYCRSPAWHIKRTEVLRRDNHKCVLCNRKAAQIHHSNYENIGKELLSDLVSLCVGCHSDFHSKRNYKNRDYGYAKVVAMFFD